VWWWVLVFLVASAAVNALPIDPTGPFPRDFPKAITSDRIAHYFDGNWIAFVMISINALLAPIAEELFFRGLLLPRSRAAFGRGDWLASGTLFTLYHLHQPWCMPVTWLDGVINQAYASKRFRSTWMGLITHTAPSFLVIAVVLGLVV
jgi:membrane protease YdiL (CAAX protease family)